MRHLLIISNWKLNGNKSTILHAIDTLSKTFNNVSKFHIIIAPPLVYLDTVNNRLLLNNCYIHDCIQLCAQNVDIHLSGAFTGDISASMLKDLNVRYVLIGHSERRIYHKENDLYISKKFSISKKSGLIPIFCIGENKEEYDAQLSIKICIKQIDSIINSLGIQAFQNSIIAYEPIWAIGRGISASPEQVQLIHKYIRNYLAQYDHQIANQILIQYGGSVNADNVLQFISQQDIDGVLIGSSSLNVHNFSMIIKLIDNYINR